MPQISRLLLASALGSVLAIAAPSQIDFNRDVRPVLSDNCFQCHGPDEKHRLAGLRLDSREGAFAERKNGRLIVPGDPGKSLLLQRMAHADKARRMPPPMSGREVSAAQIDVIRRWIEQGAKWETHWAFTAPKHTEPPAVKNTAAIRNPIDQFIQARLEREALAPAAEADKRTLLRCLSFDLTGLPPKQQDIDAFLSD